MERRFQNVLVEPTTAEETLEILRNIKGRYEDHHHVEYSDEAIDACVKLTERYATDRFFPDKAIDALDEVGSRVHLSHASVPPEILNLEKELEDVKAKKHNAVRNQNFELAASYRDRQTELDQQLQQLNESWIHNDDQERLTVTAKDVADVVSLMTGVPVQQIDEPESVRLRTMDGVLKKSIIAQDAAIDKVVKAIRRNRVGLREPNHPIGCLLYTSPSPRDS